MKKTWTAPSSFDFNNASRKKLKIDTNLIKSELPELSEPKSLQDLTVNSRKVSEVRRWVARRNFELSPILLICGPPGSGKTTTLKLVAEAEGMSVVEWITPISKVITDNIIEDEYCDKSFYDMSESKKFEDFIARSSRYPSLFQPKRPTFIIVKDIPNVFIWKPDLFHSFLEKYKTFNKTPIAFVITDDETLDLHNSLFPNDIKVKLNISLIKFNPISDTLLKKNLKVFCNKFEKNSFKLNAENLETIVKNSCGDLRSALLDTVIQLRTNEISDNQINKKRKLNKLNDDTLSVSNNCLSARDHSYDFYKKMGRILYPKRSEENSSQCSSQTGDLVHNILEISENWNKSYQSFLHENYLLTCSNFQDATIEADHFSFCDILARHVEMEKYLSIITVAGLMTANSQPKKSGFHPFKKSTNLYNMRETKFSFNESSIQRFGVSEKNFALDVAPLKYWLQIGSDSTCRTLCTSTIENIVRKSQNNVMPFSNSQEKSGKPTESNMVDSSEEEEEDNLEIDDDSE